MQRSSLAILGAAALPVLSGAWFAQAPVVPGVVAATLKLAAR